MAEPLHGVHVAADEGELHAHKGAERRIKITSEQTEGHLVAAVGTYPAGVPYDLHVHHTTIESGVKRPWLARYAVVISEEPLCDER